MFLLWIFVNIISQSSSDPGTRLHAFSPGDIMIGGLFPIHSATNRTANPGPLSCSGYDTQTFLRSQVMVHAIKEINQRTPRLLPNFTIGYDMYDTCGDVSIAIRATLQMLQNQSDPQSCFLPENISLPEPPIKALMGPKHSEVSIAVARIVALSSVPQITYSTSDLLSKKTKFPTFLRIVSSDQFQTKGMTKLVQEFKWASVAIIGSDDEYGKYGSDNLEKIFKDKKICMEFVEILPGTFNNNDTTTKETLQGLIKHINDSVAEAIIMFTKERNVEIILEAAIKHRLNRTWIASDTWSTHSRISNMANISLAGKVFGFSFPKNEVPGFKDYVLSMFNGTINNIVRYHLTQYPLCSNTSKVDGGYKSQNCTNASHLAEAIDRDESYSIYLSVQVIAEALRHLLKCDNQRCNETSKFTALELFKEMKNVSITVNNTHIEFDENGDPSVGYDIVYWNTSEPNNIQIETIGEYWPNDTLKLKGGLFGSMINDTVSVYGCYKMCDNEVLQRETTKGECCFKCFPCLENQIYSKNVCIACGPNQYSDKNRLNCLNKTDEYLNWTNGLSIILSLGGACGIVITIVFAVLFTIHCDTPIVKAVGGYLCFLEIFSLLASFCLTYIFLGKPTSKYNCIGLPLFGITFSLCIACILANLLQILVGFNFDLKWAWIKKLNRPIIVVFVVFGIQLTLSVMWMCIYPPYPNEKPSDTTILHHCEISPPGFFIAMIVYKGFLGIICFIFAFKGKQLPDLYKNAGLISIGMLLYLVIWIVFVPLYLTFKVKYTPAMECAAVLISSYSILCCHLAPKCYIMVFRKELNDQNAIAEYIRKHFEQKGMAVVR